MGHNAYITFVSTHYLSDNFYRTLAFLKNNGTLRPPPYSFVPLKSSFYFPAHRFLMPSDLLNAVHLSIVAQMFPTSVFGA